ncbi:MAG: hypothetical protein AAGA54_04485 [Myxococcota bacterium]
MLVALTTAQPAVDAPASEPVIQRPAAKRDAEPPAPADAPAELSEAEPSGPAAAEGPAPAEAAEPTPEPTPEPAPQPEVAVAPASPASQPTDPTETERFTVASGDGGPPYYTDADSQALRERHDIKTQAPDRTDQARWNCLIADPTCGRSFEVNALAAYTLRGRQGDVSGTGENPRWSSGRAQYDFWMNLPVITDIRGRSKFTRMTMGPKGGLIFSDSGSTWGNVGMAFRYWLGRGRWAPTIEFSSALSFKLGERERVDRGLEQPGWKMTRGPVGFTADVGFGLGGFGAIVLGGQYDSPLAREDIPEPFRTSAGGAFFLGFRGNILWGGPAAAAVATHIATQRGVEAP